METLINKTIWRITFLTLVFVICHSLDLRIGNYSQYIDGYEECGLLTDILIPEYDCLHNIHQFNSKLKNARNFYNGEAPWTVSIERKNTNQLFKTRCGGVLISRQWVLTTAHCLYYDSYRVNFNRKDSKHGNFSLVEKVIRHPQYEEVRHNIDYNLKYTFDIGMIKLRENISLGSGHNYGSNTICLPFSNLTIKGRWFATMAGWGPRFSRLQIAQIVVNTRTVKNGQLLTHEKRFGTSRPCYGDSGSPVWMYEMGRAFLIGIFSSGPIRDKDGCGPGGESTFVPHFVDWIMDVINRE